MSIMHIIGSFLVQIESPVGQEGFLGVPSHVVVLQLQSRDRVVKQKVLAGEHFYKLYYYNQITFIFICDYLSDSLGSINI